MSPAQLRVRLDCIGCVLKLLLLMTVHQPFPPSTRPVITPVVANNPLGRHIVIRRMRLSRQNHLQDGITFQKQHASASLEIATVFLQPHLGVPIELIAARVEESSQLYSLQVVAKELRVQRRQVEPEVRAERSVGWSLVPTRVLEIGPWKSDMRKRSESSSNHPPPTAASQAGRNPAISQSMTPVTAPVAGSMRILKSLRSPCAKWNRSWLEEDTSGCWVLL